MKKIFVVLFIIFIITVLFAGTAIAYNTPELCFEKEKGKYIYCNNPENISRNDLADSSNYNSKFLMNNENLEPEKYNFFISHYNHTGIMSSDGQAMLDAGFDIEIDVLITAREDTDIDITSIGFEVPKKKEYFLSGKKYSEDSTICCMTAWASYLKMPVHQIDSGENYIPVDFKPVNIKLKKGESFWLSKYIPNYAVVGQYRAVHLLGDFEIISGKCDFNVAALKSTGTLGDRSTFNKNAIFGSYKRDRQYKGISDSANSVTANLDYTVDYYAYHGIALPLKIFNNNYKNGNVTSFWHTNFNPSKQSYDSSSTDESNMLGFRYEDDYKLKCYGQSVKEKDKSNIWYFDTSHDDLEKPAITSRSRGLFMPNSLLSESKSTHCNLGNYGVKENYNFSMTNTTNSMRYAIYKIRGSADNIVILYDEKGNVMPGYPICKGRTENIEEDKMACIALPPDKTTKFTVTVILPTNCNGDIINSIYIKTEPEAIETYESERQYITKEQKYTGKEFYKFENKNLYFSDDGINWVQKPMSKEVSQILYGRWSNYSLTSIGNGYILRADKLGGIYFYVPQKLFRDIYFLDSDLNIKRSYQFDEYPSGFTYANGVYYADTSLVQVSDDGKEWKTSGSGVTMPINNFGRFSASCKDKIIRISYDGKSFFSVNYQENNAEYIDEYCGLYFCALKNILYISYDGVYWDKFICDEKIKTLIKADNSVIINSKYKFLLSENNNPPVVIINSTVVGYKNTPYIYNGALMVDENFTKKLMGITDFDDNNKFVSLRELADENGYEIEWDNDKKLAVLSKNN